jgi:uroporphyrinogen decarboxylase
VDVINPVQVSADKMDPETLKTSFGGKVVFYGGAFDAIQLPANTPDDIVYHTVKQNIEVLSLGGGYIFSGVHNIPGDTPVSHLRAILQAYNDYCEMHCI